MAERVEPAHGDDVDGEAGAAPQVVLASTHRATLKIIPLEALQAHALPGRRQTPPEGS